MHRLRKRRHNLGVLSDDDAEQIIIEDELSAPFHSYLQNWPIIVSLAI